MITACIASGPSLLKSDIDYCISKGWRIAACNNAAFICDRLDLFLAMDARWWEKYGRRVVKTGAECWTPSPVIANRLKINCYDMRLGGGYSKTRGLTYWGELSGYQLLQAASWSGCRKIVMLGYDMQHTGGQAHYHDDHPADWPNAQELDRKMTYWPKLAHQAARHGIELINCSRETAINCIKRKSLESV